MTAPSVFVSYSHKQGTWVWERLVPLLRAAGCSDAFIDKERFTAGREITGQMDNWQDRAGVSLLVLSPEYLASTACQHEMARAIASDPDFSHDKVLPVQRQACDMSVFTGRAKVPLWVDLVDDRSADGWRLLLRTLRADKLHADAPHWLDVRDETVRKLRENRESVNLVVRGDPNWRGLLNHVRADWLPKLAVVNLDDPATATLEGLVRTLVLAFEIRTEIPPGRGSVAALNALKSLPGTCHLALTHFDNVLTRKTAYGPDVFPALRHLISDERKLVLLVESRSPFRELLPKDHPLSNLHPVTVELHDSAP